MNQTQEQSPLLTAGPLKFGLARDHILKWIRQGRLPAGGKLPSERELARHLSIDQRTVRRGLEELVSAGLVVKRPRVGNFVRETTPSAMVTPVAVVLPDWMLHNAPRHPLAALIHQGINRVLNTDQYAVTVYWYNRDRFWEDAGRIIEARQIRAVLVHPSSTAGVASGLRRLADMGVHVSCLDYNSSLDDVDVFAVDTGANTTANLIVRKLLEGVLARGHRQIRIALYEPWELLPKIRLDIAEIYRERGLDGSEDVLINIPSNTYEAKLDVLSTVLDARPRPTALIVEDEFIASYVFRLCHEKRVKVPEELSLAAVSDNSPHIHPIALTAPDWAHLRPHAAELAAQHLVMMLKGQTPGLQRIRLRADVQWTHSVRDLNDSSEPDSTMSRMT